MIRTAVLVLVILSGLLSSVHSRCAFTQNCTNPLDPKTCGPAVAVDIEPFVVGNWSKPPACPDLMKPGAALCCNDGQNTMLSNQLSLLGLNFGSHGGDGGCDFCAANLMRYFCHFTCSPNQASYIAINGYVNFTDPFSRKNKTVMSLNYTNSYETACEIFESCKTTAYVAQMPAMQSGKGLLNMLGQNAPTQGPILMNMFFDNDPKKGIYLPGMDKCSEQLEGTDRWGYKIEKNCSCNNCQSMCTQDWDYTKALPDSLEGLDLRSILTLYGIIIIFALICQFCVRRKPEGQEEEEEANHRQDYQEAART